MRISSSSARSFRKLEISEIFLYCGRDHQVQQLPTGRSDLVLRRGADGLGYPRDVGRNVEAGRSDRGDQRAMPAGAPVVPFSLVNHLRLVDHRESGQSAKQLALDL
jgi:hypothetical protein